MKSCIQMVGLLQSRDSPHLSLSPPSDGDTRSSPTMPPVTSATTSSNTSPAFLLLYFELLPFYIYFRCYEVRSPTLKRHPPSHELRSSITCFVPPCNNKTQQNKTNKTTWLLTQRLPSRITAIANSSQNHIQLRIKRLTMFPPFR